MGIEKWIDCQVHPGMFSDERAVEIGKESYFVDAESVRGSAHSGKLRVTVVESAGGKKWAILPTSMRDSVPYNG